MPLKKGNTNIGAIYKGTTQIAKIYKGTTLLFENAKWLDYLFEHIYHSLIPTTIDNKTVQDKARLTKISGNGVVENQLVIYSNLRSLSVYGITITNNNDGSITVNGSYTGNDTNFLSLLNNYISILSGHKYLLMGGKSTATIRFYDGYSAYTDSGSGIISGGNETTSSQTITLVINAGATFDNVRIYPQLIDLTLMFGTGNEPTTLTDNRIQALLNRGYIAYNTGSYKNSRVSEIECKPYNLFDGKLESGSISDTGVLSISSNACRSVNYIEVQSGKEYSVSNSLNLSNYIVEYNADYNFISRTLTATTKTLASNTRYVKLYFYKEDSGVGTNVPTKEQLQGCFHLTGTRTGYAPYQAPSTITLPGLLELNGAINSHDTFEITNTGYVFTRNIGVVDLGSLSWTILSEGNFYCSRNLEWKKPTNDNTIGNIVCHLYTQDTATNVQSLNNYKDKTIGLNVDPQIIVRDSAYTTTADFKTAMAGIYAYLELATPQIITIPKKHLGCVDLGSLNWFVSGNKMASSDLQGIAKNVVGNQKANAYCYLYITDTNNNVYNETTNKIFSIADNGRIYVYDTAYTSAADFKSAIAGQYLFYETEDEVSDFDNIAQINAGGSITSNSEVLPNVSFKIKCKTNQ